jgi:hypothetical protein
MEDKNLNAIFLGDTRHVTKNTILKLIGCTIQTLSLAKAILLFH